MVTENKPCPACREIGDDTTGDHLYVALSGGKELNYWICRKGRYREHKDGRVLYHPRTGSKSTLREAVIPTEPKIDIEDLPFVTDRGIPQFVRKLFGVRSAVSTTTGQPGYHYYPRTSKGKIVNWKIRDIANKRFGKTKSGVSSDTELFGMNAVSGSPRNILITEGEEDAMAAHYMVDKKIHNVACLSLPDGTGSTKAIAKNIEWLAKADKVYFVPDSDDEGQKIIQKIAELLPSVLIVSDLSEKDPNAMLLAGKADDFVKSVLRAQKYKPPFLVNVKDVLKEATTLPTHGRTLPWPTLDKAMFGMRDGEGMYLGAGVKIGKSEFINELITHRIKAADGDIPAVIKFEEQPHMTVRKVAGKLDGVFYHRPDIKFDPKDLERTAASLDKKLFLYRAFGAADWETVRYYIRYCVSEGAKTVIIDPVTRLTNHMSSSDTETALRRLSDELSGMAQDLGFFYVVTCHLKAPQQGKPHERGGKVQSNQFRGSRAMMEACYYMVGIERNKDPALTDAERNTSTFVLLEDRAFGNSLEFKVHYDPTNGDYQEVAPVLKHLGGAK